VRQGFVYAGSASGRWRHQFQERRRNAPAQKMRRCDILRLYRTEGHIPRGSSIEPTSEAEEGSATLPARTPDDITKVADAELEYVYSLLQLSASF
jgi:hypothetical protein